MTSDGRINLVLPVQDYARLCAMARRQRTTVSSLVRMAVLSAAPRPYKGERHRVSVRLPSDAAEAVEGKARASGMTPTGFLRAAVQGLLERQP
ncbi:hypothetical protein CNY89_02680 [Amaricoccus sp. HAR-UPW-R2A-40]|nr:hypothetical protein CNY89_02680 [Amaricoccus sp. HAR-UPW-R2A-40]